MIMSVEIVGSKLPQFASDAFKKPADNKKTGYGQGGYMGASSDTDLSNPTQSTMAADMEADVLSKAIARNVQTRTVSADQYPAAHGQVAQQDPAKVFNKATLPASTSKDETEPVRKPS
jgi:hypothetical protein